MRRDHSRDQADVTRRDYLFSAGSIAALSAAAGCIGLGGDDQDGGEAENETGTNDSENGSGAEDESESPDTEEDEGDEDGAAEGPQEGPGNEIGNESPDNATEDEPGNGTEAEDDDGEDELDDPPLTVVVENAEGEPVSEGVTVNANLEDGEVSYVLTDFEEGSATVQNAAPGEYIVVAEHDEHGTVEESVTVEGGDAEVTLAFDGGGTEGGDRDGGEDDPEDNQSEGGFDVEGDVDDGRFEQQYRIGDVPYRVDHPAGWGVEEGDDYVQIQNGDETAWIWIEFREVRDDLDREVQRFREEFDPNPSVETHADDPVTLSSGEDGHRFVIEMTEREIFAHELIAQGNGYYYRTAVVVLQSEYDEEYAQLAEEILATVALR